jgi:hypothetical protein
MTRAGDFPGLVNDLNARALGGVSGHAGLFGTAKGVAALAGEILMSFKENGRFFDNDTVRSFCARAGFTSDSTRTLGFDTLLRRDQPAEGYFLRIVWATPALPACRSGSTFRAT